jgi:hypothetical protein
MDYGEFNQILDIAHNQISSAYFECVFKVKIKNSSIGLNDISIWLTLDSKEIARASIDEDGNITLPVLDEEKADDVFLHVNQSKEDVTVSLYTDVAPITTTNISYRELFSLVSDMNHFTKVMANGMSWLIPSLDEIEFIFEEHSVISFTEKNGDKLVYETNRHNKIVVPFKQTWMKLNPTIEFSALPKRYDPSF